MCRLLLMNREALDWLLVESKDDYLSTYLEQLIRSNGGDGNGLAALHADGVAWVKGTALSVNQMINWFLDEYFAGATSFLFHTRRASIGAVSAENCHPFLYADSCLVHNGHDSRLIVEAAKDGYIDDGKPDSQAAAYLLHKYGPACLASFSGTFLGYHQGKPFYQLGQGYWPLWRIEAKRGNMVELFCSERPWHLEPTCYQATDLRPWPTAVPAWPMAQEVRAHKRTLYNKPTTIPITKAKAQAPRVHAVKQVRRKVTRLLSYADLGIDAASLTERESQEMAVNELAAIRRLRADRAYHLSLWEQQ